MQPRGERVLSSLPRRPRGRTALVSTLFQCRFNSIQWAASARNHDAPKGLMQD